MKQACLLFLVIIVNVCNAQLYDRNWVFGVNAGISFQNDSGLYVYKTKVKVNERAASISDSAGNLIFYLTDAEEQLYAHIVDSGGNLIMNGDSLIADNSETSGLVILPSYDATQFLVFHLGLLNSSDCPNPTCIRLFLTVVRIDNGILKVEEKNTEILHVPLFERLAAVKHANGEDWWLVAHTEFDSLSNRFYKFLITDTIIAATSYQDIGAYTGLWAEQQGALKFSRSGNLLGLIRADSKVFEIYHFDRCSGMLTDYWTDHINTTQKTYGFEFSKNENFAYISSFDIPPSAKLFQVDLINRNMMEIASSPYTFAQLQMAPNSKIYVANKCLPASNEFHMPCNQYLGAINFPDSSGSSCGFEINAVYLGDSSHCNYGLPNMPDYNLGLLSIYNADAGVDTVICTEDTTVKGVLLGIPAIAGVTYSWYPADSLNSTHIAQPFAYPKVSTWYYVTLTDSSIKNSCQSRTDSVFVEVKDCSLGTETANYEQPGIRIYPNPANETLYISLLKPDYRIQLVTITDLSGKDVLQTKEQVIPLKDLSGSLYFVKVQFVNGKNTVCKIIVQNP